MRTLFILLLCAITAYTTAQQQKAVTIYFDFNSPQLNTAALRQIDSLVKAFNAEAPVTLTVSGYTDKAGTDDYNNRLATERANAVAQALKAALHPAVTIAVNSYGERGLLTEKDEAQNLNRRVIITYITALPVQSLISLEGIRQDVAEQRFSINLDDTAFVMAAEGTRLKISPGSLQTKKGVVAYGMADVVIKEYYRPGDILLAGLQSVAPQGLLQSGGMLKISFIQAGDTLDQQTRKPVELRMPVVNKDLSGMNVFTMNHQDSVLWNNTGKLFDRFRGYWKIPPSVYQLFLELHSEEDGLYTKMKIGKKVTREFNTTGFALLFRKFKKSLIKKANITYIKEDSLSIKTYIKAKFTHRGYRTLGKRNGNSTFYINYLGPEYRALINNLRWINCDRFYNSPQKIDFYVNAPGYKLTNLLVYFKDIRAFMQFDKITANGQFIIDKVPAGMAVTLVGIGKKGSDFYFGKQDFVTSSKATSAVEIKKVSEEDFKNSLKGL